MYRVIFANSVAIKKENSNDESLLKMLSMVNSCQVCIMPIADDKGCIKDGCVRWICGHAYCKSCTISQGCSIRCIVCSRPKTYAIMRENRLKCGHEYCWLMNGGLELGCHILKEENFNE